MLPTLRLGLVGLGLATTFSLPALVGHPHLRIAAAADVRESALAQFAHEYGGETFGSVEELSRSPKVDAVYISTPNYLHAEHAILAATHGKHILVEKPLALTLDEADRMIAAADAHGVQLVYGHTHAYDPPIRKIRELVQEGSLGRLTMLHTWNYTDILYRPRAPWELDDARGGGVLFIQASHQIDTVRLIGGGAVRSVRAMTGSAARERPAVGHYTAYLDLADGTPATLVYSGYAHFDTAELHHWVGERGQARAPETHAQTWAAYRARQTGGESEAEAARRDAIRYGGAARPPRPPAPAPAHQYFFGLTLVSCERGDIRQSPDGLFIYDEQGRREITLPTDVTGNQLAFDALYGAATENRPALHDGRWGRATLEVALAIRQSARERREIVLTEQAPAQP